MVKRMELKLFVILTLLVFMSCVGVPKTALPPLEADALTRLKDSPRHGEWVQYSAAGGDIVNAWLVYPEIKSNAPVVIVVHEIYGLTDWARAVADQFAAEGFIAIAPDFLSGKAPGGKGSEALDKDSARPLVRALEEEEIISRLNGAAKYATSLPSAKASYGIVGFCWGGGVSFNYAAAQRVLGAAIVYYGVSADIEKLENIQAPVLGLYGEEDNRVNATIEGADNEMKRLGKSYEIKIYPGAGHGFLRAQDGKEGANLAAAEKAWDRTIAFFKEHLEK